MVIERRRDRDEDEDKTKTKREKKLGVEKTILAAILLAEDSAAGRTPLGSLIFLVDE